MIFWKLGRLLRALVLSCVILNSGPSLAEEKAHQKQHETRLIDRTYRPPNEAEIESFRGFLRQLAQYQSEYERVAYRCQGRLVGGVIYVNDLPERFVTIHAVDHALDAERHVQRSTFTDDDDPILRSVVTDKNGYADSRTSKVRFFPRSDDRLRIGDDILLANQKTVGRDKYKRSRDDRSFDPISFALLPLSSFQHDVAVTQVSRFYGIEILTPSEVSIVGDSYVMKNRSTTTRGPTPSVMFVEFVKGLPVTFEMWWMVEDEIRLQYRTVSQWKEFEKAQFPVRIEAIGLGGPRRAAFEAELVWKFDEDVPDRLFELTDVSSPDALQW